MILKREILRYDIPWSRPDVYLFTGNPIRRNDGGLVMGRGAARMVRDSYPGIDKRIHTSEAVSFTDITTDQTIGWFKVKDHWKNPARLSFIKESTELLAHYAKKLYSLTWHMNMPGVGNGKLEGRNVLPILQKLPDNVIIYR